MSELWPRSREGVPVHVALIQPCIKAGNLKLRQTIDEQKAATVFLATDSGDNHVDSVIPHMQRPSCMYSPFFFIYAMPN